MFDLSDTRSKRRRTIFGEAQIDPKLGVVLAAMDFEWTCRRAVLALSETPTVTLYEKFIAEYTSFDGLKKAWQEEVMKVGKVEIPLPEVVEKVFPWSWVYNAMQCRNVIVHGTESRVSDRECRWAVCVLEDACDVVADFVEERHNKGIFSRINRRRPKEQLGDEASDGTKSKQWHKQVGREIAKYDAKHWISTGWIGGIRDAKKAKPKK